eukprot:m.374084 g.374084  ORF g.374084 m.374084 type:complete len:681 (+) comp28166_c0_seq14:3361-5403(+)
MRVCTRTLRRKPKVDQCSTVPQERERERVKIHHTAPINRTPRVVLEVWNTHVRRLRCAMASGWAKVLRDEARGAAPWQRRQRILGSRALVESLELTTKLEEHDGCVNTLSWSEDGRFCLSGSDDTQLVIWNMRRLCAETTIPTIHTDNIFGAQFVPGTGGRQVVSCAADGTLLLHHVDRELSGAGSGVVMCSAPHFLLKMAFYPPSDGRILAVSGQSILMVDLRTQKTWCCDDDAQDSPVTALAFDPNSPNTLAVGNNSPIVSLYDIRMAGGQEFAQLQPAPRDGDLGRQQAEAVSSLEFSAERPGLLLANYRDDSLFTFDTRRAEVARAARAQLDDGAGPAQVVPFGDEDRAVTAAHCQEYKGRTNSDTFAKDAAFVLGSEWVATGGDCGHLYIWNVETGALVRRVVADRCVVNCVAAHPSLPVIAVSGIDSDVKVFACGETERGPGRLRKRSRRQDGVESAAASTDTMLEPAAAALGSSESEDSDSDSDDAWDDDADWMFGDDPDPQSLEAWVVTPHSFRQRMLLNPRVATMREAAESITKARGLLADLDTVSNAGSKFDRSFSALQALHFGALDSDLDGERAELEIVALTWILEAAIEQDDRSNASYAVAALEHRSVGRDGLGEAVRLLPDHFPDTLDGPELREFIQRIRSNSADSRVNEAEAEAGGRTATPPPSAT